MHRTLNKEILCVDNVHFACKGKEQSLAIYLLAFKDEKLPLVGGSGSGKSTMCDLLIRLYDPSEGHILLDGTDIRQFTFASYRRFFGLSHKNRYSSSDTIIIISDLAQWNNYRQSNYTEAARIANAAEFIEKAT